MSAGVNASAQKQANLLITTVYCQGLDRIIKSSAQEGSSRLLKVRPFFTEDGPVACVREDPELRLRYGLRHFDGELDGIERITVALHDEVQVVVTRGKRSRAFKDSPNLRIPTRMTTAKKFPLFLREAV